MTHASATYVLVHGAWGGSYSWTPLAERMRARGHRVFTPSLTGLGVRSHLFRGAINLSTHIEDVCNTIRCEQLEGFVLAGHSYGGMVATGVADRYAEHISALVYIDAFLPENGKCVWDYTSRDNNQRFAEAGEHGGIAIPSPAQNAAGMSAAEKALRAPMPVGTLIEKLKLTGKADRIVKRLYVLAANNPGATFRQFYDRVRAQSGWKTAEVASGHSIHREQPEELIRLLESMI
ncbi:MAG: alpha/beta fold hydrolase [Steroidobacteraceae bacterium]